jgi:hypothetical protein
MTINWLVVANNVLKGFANGTGFVLALSVWVLIFNRHGKKDQEQQ